MVQIQHTKTQIIESAIHILKVQGTEGLTMRKVATQAEMSLGNLQYHYKDKDALFSGLAEHYFTECIELLDAYSPSTKATSTKGKLQDLICFYLDHVDQITDMCRIFRELWALATRDEAIHEQLINYYKLTAEKLDGILTQISGDKRRAQKMTALLLPYFEGYSITHDALKQDKQAIARLLTQLCCDLR